MVELLLGNFVPYIVAGVAAIVAFWGYGKKKQSDGRKQVVDEIEKADMKEAGEIRKKLDAMATDGNALERLRSRGRLRD